MRAGICKCAAPETVSSGKGKDLFMHKQVVNDAALDRFQKVVRYAYFPVFAVALRDLHSTIMAVSVVTCSIECPCRKTEAFFEGGKLPIYDHCAFPLFRKTEQNNENHEAAELYGCP